MTRPLRITVKLNIVSLWGCKGISLINQVGFSGSFEESKRDVTYRNDPMKYVDKEKNVPRSSFFYSRKIGARTTSSRRRTRPHRALRTPWGQQPVLVAQLRRKMPWISCVCRPASESASLCVLGRWANDFHVTGSIGEWIMKHSYWLTRLTSYTFFATSRLFYRYNYAASKVEPGRYCT